MHRDIKPANLLWSTSERLVKIADFGIARLLSDADKTDRLTREGMAIGTPDYMAPEQAQEAHTVDIRADLYSLGCTLYHLLAGTPPFSGGTLAQKLARRAVETVEQSKGRFTLFAVVDALTRLARELPNAGDRTAADEQASQLLSLVA